MTRSEQPTDTFADELEADSRRRAVGALLKIPPLRKLWGAQLTGTVGDRLALLVLVVLTAQAAVGAQAFGGGYRGAAFAVAAVFGARVLAALLFGAVLLGPLGSLTGPGGVLDRRWTMIGSDVARLALLIVAPLWIDWVPADAVAWLLVTVFVTGVAERLWTVAKDGAAPGLLPAPVPGAGTVRPLPDRLDALRRLDQRTGFVAFPIAAAGLVVVTLVGNLIGLGVDWFGLHQAALASYVAAGLFAASGAVLYLLELPGDQATLPAPRCRACAATTAGAPAPYRCSCSAPPPSPVPSPPPWRSPCCTPPTSAGARSATGFWCWRSPRAPCSASGSPRTPSRGCPGAACSPSPSPSPVWPCC